MPISRRRKSIPRFRVPGSGESTTSFILEPGGSDLASERPEPYNLVMESGRRFETASVKADRVRHRAATAPDAQDPGMADSPDTLGQQ